MPSRADSRIRSEQLLAWPECFSRVCVCITERRPFQVVLGALEQRNKVRILSGQPTCASRVSRRLGVMRSKGCCIGHLALLLLLHAGTTACRAWSMRAPVRQEGALLLEPSEQHREQLARLPRRRAARELPRRRRDDAREEAPVRPAVVPGPSLRVCLYFILLYGFYLLPVTENNMHYYFTDEQSA